jgi:hypothetical protein
MCGSSHAQTLARARNFVVCAHAAAALRVIASNISTINTVYQRVCTFGVKECASAATRVLSKGSVVFDRFTTCMRTLTVL